MANRGKLVKAEAEKFPIPEGMMDWARELVWKWEHDKATQESVLDWPSD